jgi:succinate dehydrogenase / fumarate reductase cytochrome b subunit
MMVLSRLRQDTFRRRLAFVVHRGSGVGLLLFLIIHVGDTSLVVIDPRAYNTVIGIYRLPAFDGIEVVLVGGLIFHCFNGVRIVVQDFWSGWITYERQLWQATYALTLAVWIVLGYFMVVKQ